MKISLEVIPPQKDQKKRANEKTKTGFAAMAELVNNVDITNIKSMMVGDVNFSTFAAAA